MSSQDTQDASSTTETNQSEQTMSGQAQTADEKTESANNDHQPDVWCFRDNHDVKGGVIMERTGETNRRGEHVVECTHEDCGGRTIEERPSTDNMHLE